LYFIDFNQIWDYRQALVETPNTFYADPSGGSSLVHALETCLREDRCFMSDIMKVNCRLGSDKRFSPCKQPRSLNVATLGGKVTGRSANRELLNYLFTYLLNK